MSETEHVSHAELTFTAENAEVYHGDAIHQWAVRQKEKSDSFKQHEQEEYMMAVVQVAQKARILADKARMYAEVDQKKQESRQSVIEARRRLAEMAKEDGIDIEALKKKKASNTDETADEEKARLEEARDKLKDYFDK